MTNNQAVAMNVEPEPELPEPELDYAAAEGLVVEALRQEQAAKLAALRRQADAAKERARRSQARLDRAVVMLASTRPEREDWYEHPGALPRKQLLAAAKLNTMGLHRTMERYRRAAGKRGKR